MAMNEVASSHGLPTRFLFALGVLVTGVTGYGLRAEIAAVFYRDIAGAVSWKNVIEGSVSGVVAAVVFAVLVWLYSWWNRPRLHAWLANVRETSAGPWFDLYLKNVGRTAFQEPTIHIDGLTAETISFEQAGRQWVNDADQVVYHHAKSLLPSGFFSLQFRVLDRSKLAVAVDVTLLHRGGVESRKQIAISVVKEKKNAA